MLLELRIKNYKCFKDEQVFSFVASNDKSLPENVIENGKLRVLRTAVLYGANASGKSTVMQALKVIRDSIVHSASVEPGRRTAAVPFLLDSEATEKPSSFEVTFLLEGVRYQYGFSATPAKYHDEWLLAYPRGRAQTWFERANNPETDITTWSFGPSMRGEKQKIADRTRTNALFLSVAAQWDHPQLLNLYTWFQNKFVIIRDEERIPELTSSLLFSGKEDEELKGVVELCRQLLSRADFGIASVNVQENQVNYDDVSFPEDMPEQIRHQLVRWKAQQEPYNVFLRHQANEGSVEFGIEQESRGTRRFYKLAGPWILALLLQRFLAVDEIESSLHPLLARELISMFQSSQYQGMTGQLLITTHDTTLLDPTFFRRDQVWFVEKDEAGASRLSSLVEYRKKPARKGEAMQKRYLAGLYGGIPSLAERFVDG